MLKELGMFGLYAGGAVLGMVIFGKLYKKLKSSRTQTGRDPRDFRPGYRKDDTDS